ncbi:hypothetical protein IFM89_025802 [Coptis chinensis]|uniref:Uncharacterized protein n=1 Tax=Coptis chinensis TaxID=261450 RepID=A0A835HFE5_9MAGN|nr:hypothetical protein IFM89_025802 [Coptis chinensis]
MDKQTSKFKFLKPRGHSGRVFMCKSEFEERTSPDETPQHGRGVGPGLMDAATKGALQAKKPVGGFKIGNMDWWIFAMRCAADRIVIYRLLWCGDSR